ncbi:MAG: adenylate kinase [Ignavibacteriae bacterium]|nr:MAG: adenylate kinase [Ignavibacteriota bacterium]
MKEQLLIFFGAPGVGKGTQAKIVSEKLLIPHISTGDILRDAIKEKTDLGLKAKEIMGRGELVPDDIMLKLVANVLKNKKCKNGFILDGFPRTLKQAQALTPILDEIFIANIKIINIKADNETIINRLMQRRMCSACGNIVNLNFLQNLDKCPTCGSIDSFIRRKDDTEEVIKNRLEIFHQTTKPVLDFCKENGKEIINIDGKLPVDEITSNILEAIS